MPFKRKSQYQLTVLSVFLIIVLLFYTFKTYSLQISNAEKYTGRTDGAASSRTSVLKAPRGEILDCYGRQIAINRDGYNIVFNKAYVKENLNDVILSLIKLLSENGTEWFDQLPITPTSPYKFIEGKSTDKLISKLKLAHYASADDCFKRMVEKYELEDYSKENQRLICGHEVSCRINGDLVQLVNECSGNRIDDGYLVHFISEELDAHGIFPISDAHIHCVSPDSESTSFEVDFCPAV